jgi:nitrite reductase (NADH) large subunit
MNRPRLVVVGNGMAGARAVEEVLSRGRDRFDIAVFGGERYGSYNRIMLSNVLNGSQCPDDILINPPQWYADNGVALHLGTFIDAIDRTAKIVTARDGTQEPYDKLLIATGSHPFIPPMAGAYAAEGTLKTGLFAYRGLDDCHAILDYVKSSRRIVTIGGGLLGLEVARAMMVKGAESHIVHLADHLLEMQLDAAGGAILRKAIEAMGIAVHVGKLTTEVVGDDRVTGLKFKDGGSLDCDMVIVATGIRPNAELGVRAGLKVERAIVVDDQMRSVDDEDIYAVGECAQHRGRVYGLLGPVWEQGKVFADHITGNSAAAYHGSKLATKLKVMGIELASMGITEPGDERDELIQFMEPKRGLYKKLIVRDGRLVGGILMGDISKAPYLMQAFDRDAPLPDERVALLFDIGTDRTLAVKDLPASAHVCNCNGITKGAIEECVAAGKRDAKAVMAATRAGTGCGTCKPLVAEVIAWFRGDRTDDAAVAGGVPAIAQPRPQPAPRVSAA